MKFRVALKDPDTLADAVEAAVLAELKHANPTLSEEERDQIADSRKEKTLALCAKWFKHGEYLTVEIDTKARTATVVPEK